MILNETSYIITETAPTNKTLTMTPESTTEVSTGASTTVQMTSEGTIHDSTTELVTTEVTTLEATTLAEKTDQSTTEITTREAITPGSTGCDPITVEIDGNYHHFPSTLFGLLISSNVTCDNGNCI